MTLTKSLACVFFNNKVEAHVNALNKLHRVKKNLPSDECGSEMSYGAGCSRVKKTNKDTRSTWFYIPFSPFCHSHIANNTRFHSKSHFCAHSNEYLCVCASCAIESCVMLEKISRIKRILLSFQLSCHSVKTLTYFDEAEVNLEQSTCFNSLHCRVYDF
jgi:hypothetical protein